MEEYNLAGIRQRVLIDKLDDEEFDPGVVDRFINDTLRDIYRKYQLTFMEKIFSGTVPAGTTMFKMPDDVGLVQSRTVTGPNGTERSLKPGQMDFRSFTALFPTPTNNEPGAIYNWALYGNSMMLSRPTDQDYTMNIFYYKKPKKLVEGSDIPELPEEFSELLVLGAYMRVLRRNEDFDLAKEVNREEYLPMLNDLASFYGYREADGPVIMKNRYQRGGRGYNTTPNGLVLKSY